MNNERFDEERKFRGNWAPRIVNSTVRKNEQFCGCRTIAPSIRQKQQILFDERGAPRPNPISPEQTSQEPDCNQSLQINQNGLLPPEPPPKRSGAIRSSSAFNDQSSSLILERQNQLQQQQQLMYLQAQQNQQRYQLQQQQQQLQQDQQQLMYLQAQHNQQRYQLQQQQQQLMRDSSWLSQPIPSSIPTTSGYFTNPPASLVPQNSFAEYPSAPPYSIPVLPVPPPPPHAIVGFTQMDLGDDSTVPVVFRY